MDLVVSFAEIFVQHPVNDAGDIRLEGVANTGEDVVFVDNVESHAAALKNVQNLKKCYNY